jgi:hypothetical protein
MLRPHTQSLRSAGIWSKAPAVTAKQVVILLVVSTVALFAVVRALDASRSRFASSAAAAPVAVAGPCPQLAETFDTQRAACLRRRWTAVREMRPWRDASQDVLLEDCLRSPGGAIAVPFKTHACGNPEAAPRMQRAQN